MLPQTSLEIAKRLVKNIMYRPRGLDLGKNSWIARPSSLHNRSRIHIGAHCNIRRYANFSALLDYNGVEQCGEIYIGDDVYIGGFCNLHAMRELRIGRGSVLSEFVYISDIAHGLDPAAGLIMQQPLETKGAVEIGEYVFIGLGASILPGVTLGEHCVVGTRSVVTRSFPAYSMVAGCPARLIKTFDPLTSKWVPAVDP